ncbi:MAG: 23S rRNA (pseudouridine(1915)-N(3))-methyltransferase RlmH [Bacteroidales bacterium]|nr:23S rRNA (pseudouridine(1915)-N(3))-methyltransferase RlmH [Bacteroidales bacterium]
MNIRLIVVSKTDVPYLQQGIEEYVARLKHYTAFTIDVVPAVKGQLPPDEVRRREGEQILKRLNGTERVVLLDEHGQQTTSVGFAEQLQRYMNAGTRELVFVIGGAFGFAPEVYAAAQAKMALSVMTFNHQMVRLIFVEQLYRAFTILRNEKYHNT